MKLAVRVVGRPAPQGSHEVGANGYMMHSSNYLSAWRARVDRATRAAYVAYGLTREDMPLIPNPRPAYLVIEHVVQDDQCRAAGSDEPTGVPDVDKLLRATIDGLAAARAFANDSQVVHVTTSKRRPQLGEPTGAIITIDDNREINEMTTENPTEYQLILSRVGQDADGGTTWETMFEVTDTAPSLAATALPYLASRLGAPAPLVPIVTTAATEDKPKPGRPRKATPAPAAGPILPEQLPQAAPAPAFNPFA